MTPERFARLKQVLDQRQPDLTVLMDNVHKRHNFSAVLRSCDAVGILEVHGVWPSPRLRPYGVTSGGAGKWISVVTHPDMAGAIDVLKRDGFSVMVADAGEGARDYREADYTRPVALVLGAELEGVSAAARSNADLRVRVPMSGMATSLNVSVAAALLLFEARRQREAAGLYRRPRLDPERRRRLLFEWAHPKVANYCRRRGLPYPALDEDGQIRDPIPQP